MLECSGVIEQKAPRKYTLIKKDMEVSDGDKSVVVIPQTNIEVNLTIDFTSKAIGKQNIEYSHNRESFRNDIADARTFGFIHELDYLKRKGLGLGASLDNAVGIDGDTVLNPEGLRYRDEFVRHKLLDMLGDIYIASHVIGRFEAIKTGHGLNNLLLNKILSDASNYEFVDASSINDRLSNS
jgi:UDP-3-O-[3-hydroxymyristoyl] N-acetylglucosamine deacetylase